MKNQKAVLITSISAIIIGAAMIISGLYIQLDWNFLSPTVELNIPKAIVELVKSSNQDLDFSLTEEQRQHGFTKVERNVDGSITYTMKKKNYKTFISDLKTQTKDEIDEIVNSGTYSSIKNITYNDNFSEITIMVDKTSFENSLDSISTLMCGTTSIMYQNFDINSPKKCVITIKDSTTGEVIQTKTYPEQDE